MEQNNVTKTPTPWWVREALMTPKDRDAIRKAQDCDWTEIDEGWAETEHGREELHDIKMR